MQVEHGRACRKTRRLTKDRRPSRCTGQHTSHRTVPQVKFVRMRFRASVRPWFSGRAKGLTCYKVPSQVAVDGSTIGYLHRPAIAALFIYAADCFEVVLQSTKVGKGGSKTIDSNFGWSLIIMPGSDESTEGQSIFVFVEHCWIVLDHMRPYRGPHKKPRTALRATLSQKS